MKLTATLTILTIISTGTVHAESRVEALCGAGHVNEIASTDDVVANPDGYYIRSLQTQLTHGDPRIVSATGNEFHLCTRSAATPDMDSRKAEMLMNERRVKFLFAPIDGPKADISS